MFPYNILMLSLIYVAVDEVGNDHGAGAISKPKNFSAPKNISHSPIKNGDPKGKLHNVQAR